MGCWNGTCGLTNLPIIAGDKMYVFPIAENYSDSFCYSTAFYRPSVVPFVADYNDYGAGENCTGPALDLLIEGIKGSLVEMEVGENKYHDIEIKREDFDVDKFFEACHEGRLEYLNPMRGWKGQPQTKKMYFTMIRKDVVDRLWSEWKFDMWKGSDCDYVPEGFETDQYYIKNVTYERLAELLPEYMEARYEKFQKNVKVAKETDDEQAKIAVYQLLQGYFFQSYKDRDHILSDKFSHIFGSGYADGGFHNFIPDLSTEIVALYISGKKEEAIELLRQCLVGYMVNSYMEAVRKIWTPPMHQGSQSQEFSEYKLLNSIMNDIMVEKEKEYDWEE